MTHDCLSSVALALGTHLAVMSTVRGAVVLVNLLLRRVMDFDFSTRPLMKTCYEQTYNECSYEQDLSCCLVVNQTSERQDFSGREFSLIVTLTI